VKNESVYGGALVAGALTIIVTMALHPTGSQLLADVQHTAAVAVAVHAIALAGLPVSFFGAIGLTRRLAEDGEAPIAALVAYGMAVVAVLIAAVASGLLATGLAAQIAHSAGSQHDLALALFEYTARINRAFAKVYVYASSAAILLWSASIVSHRRLAPGAGILGITIAVLALAALSVGHLRLDVHGFGAVALSQGIWMITVGTLMLRARPRRAAGANV